MKIKFYCPTCKKQSRCVVVPNFKLKCFWCGSEGVKILKKGGN